MTFDTPIIDITQMLSALYNVVMHISSLLADAIAEGNDFLGLVP